VSGSDSSPDSKIELSQDAYIQISESAVGVNGYLKVDGNNLGGAVFAASVSNGRASVSECSVLDASGSVLFSIKNGMADISLLQTGKTLALGGSVYNGQQAQGGMEVTFQEQATSGEFKLDFKLTEGLTTLAKVKADVDLNWDSDKSIGVSGFDLEVQGSSLAAADLRWSFSESSGYSLVVEVENSGKKLTSVRAMIAETKGASYSVFGEMEKMAGVVAQEAETAATGIGKTLGVTEETPLEESGSLSGAVSVCGLSSFVVSIAGSLFLA